MVGAVLGVVLFAALGLGLWVREELRALDEPMGDAAAPTFVVAKGTTVGQIARRLKDDGLLRYPQILKLYARLHPAVTKIKAGEYGVAAGDSVAKLLGRISRGEVLQHSFTVPEGWNLREIAPIVEKAGVATAAEFLAKTTDAAFIKQLGVDAPSLEGYLFPDTYSFARGAGAGPVIQAMVEHFHKRLPGDYADRAARLGLTLHQAVTLASVVEKETGAAHERRLISAVFHNRLKKRMRLQSDPTVIYGIPNYDGNIRKADLLTTTPYNTYRINGLPYGPIANPGHDALLAVIDPAPVNYLYFVSRNDGSHVFSATLKEHNRAVDQYQRRRTAKAATAATP